MKQIPKIAINLVYEDYISGLALKKILSSFADKFEVNNEFAKEGSGYIRKNIRNFNYASKEIPYLILTDLDLYKCPVELLNKWIDFKKSNRLIFRIAVREVESWLLADVNGISDFLKIDKKNLSLYPDQLTDPKQTLINLARKSKSKEISSGIAPKIGSTSKQGMRYNYLLGIFVNEHWNLENARTLSESLRRTTKALNDFKP